MPSSIRSRPSTADDDHLQEQATVSGTGSWSTSLLLLINTPRAGNSGAHGELINPGRAGRLVLNVEIWPGRQPEHGLRWCGATAETITAVHITRYSR
jgi:hypothetical protein